MKFKMTLPALALAALGTAFSAHAHKPEEHNKEAESPNCAAMEEMGHSKMNMDDPVMQAMMKQCMNTMHHGHGSHDMKKDEKPKDDHQQSSSDQHMQHSGHQH